MARKARSGGVWGAVLSSVVAAGVLGLAASAGAQTAGVPYRYGDSSTSQVTTTPRVWRDLGLFASLGERVVFIADTTAEVGRELWITDGTAGGTRLLADLDPRTGHDLAMRQVRTFAGPGVRSAVFLGSDETGERLAVTDGTEAGTSTMVLGPGNSTLVGVAGGHVLLQRGSNFISADGSGVVTLLALGSPPTRAAAGAEVGGRLYFWVGSPQYRAFDLWVTDGTAAGTRRVDGYAMDISNAPPTIAVAGAQLFTWWSDGVVTTPVVIDAATGVAQAFAFDGGSPDPTAVVLPLPDGSGAVYETGMGLVRTDGTPEGTQLLAPAVEAPTLGNGDTDPLPKIIQSPSGPVTVFLGRTASTGIEPWVTDGTPAGTRILMDVSPGVGSSAPVTLGAAPGRYYATTPFGVLMTNGDPAGTSIVGSDQVWSPTSSSIQGPFTAALGDGVLVRRRTVVSAELGQTVRYIGATRSSLETGPATRLWWTQWAFPAVPAGEAAVFGVGDVSGQGQLWRTEASSATTEPLTPLIGGMSEFKTINGLAWFLVRDTATQSSLWRSDGTEPGSFAVGSFTHSNPPTVYPIIAGGDGVVFGCGQQFTASPAAGSLRAIGPAPGYSGVDAASRVYECTLRTSDQTISVTANGTTTSLAVVAHNNYLGAVFQAMGDRMYYAAYDGTYKLYRSDGTAAGTQLLRSGLQTELIGTAGGRIIAADTDGVSLRVVGVAADGTATVLAGGLRVVDDVRNFGDRVIMLIDDGEHGLEPWITDGTVEGTRMIAETAPGRRGAVGTTYKNSGWGGRFISNGVRTPLLYPAGDRCFFSVATDTRPAHLWVTDGTAAGTHPLAARADDPRQDALGATFVAVKAGAVLFRGWTPDREYQYYAVRLCDADFNTDGFVDFFDDLAFIDAFEAGTPDADFNGDGFLDFFDFDAFVGAFERGC